ncbi:hypothetical protein L195_g034247, partial [Trifolium pratense]
VPFKQHKSLASSSNSINLSSLPCLVFASLRASVAARQAASKSVPVPKGYVAVYVGEKQSRTGLEVCSDSKGMFHQHKYTKDLISLAGLTLATPVDTPPLEVYVKYCCDVGDLLSDPLLYRKLVSILNYLTITRPDISFAVQQHPVTSFHSGILVISRAYGYLLNPCGSYFKPFKDVGFCYGRGGGIALLWRSSYNCSIVNFSQNHINVQVTDQVNGNWRLTGFYGFPNGGRRRDSWNFLRHLSQESNLLCYRCGADRCSYGRPPSHLV